MRGHCQVCQHSMRGAIDEHLRAGRDLRSLSDEFGVLTRALRHHRDSHVVPARPPGGRRSGARPRA